MKITVWTVFVFWRGPFGSPASFRVKTNFSVLDFIFIKINYERFDSTCSADFKTVFRLAQVRSPFPMIPIGGIQMVHSVPTAVTTPLAQQGAEPAASRLLLQKSASEDSVGGEASYFSERGRRGGDLGERGRESTSPHPSSQEREGGGVRQEQEETIRTCTKAIASLCIDTQESVLSGGGGGGGGDGRNRGRAPPSSSPSGLSSDSHQQQKTSTSSLSPPHPPGIQHFSGLKLRPPHPTSPHPSSSPHPYSQGLDSFRPPTASIKLEDDPAAESTNRSEDVS